MKTGRLFGLALLLAAAAPASAQTFFPAKQTQSVNPDAQLKLTFSAPPVIGKTGKIRIFDASDDHVVDTLDLAIPPGPTEKASGAALTAPYLAIPYPYARAKRATNADTKPGTPSAGALPTPDAYQLTIIGGFTDGFHFYPVMVNGNTATIQPHHDLLQYGKSYYVQVEPGVLSAAGFSGIADKSWRFSTKNAGPKADATHLVVSADGKGDFNTVQGAMDFVPDNAKTRITIDVRDGVYQELVYFRNKTNITLKGQSRDRTIVRYANNEVLNPHPANLRTNELATTFPSRRAAFAADHVSDFHILDMTIETTQPGQAEGLLIAGERNILSHVHVIGAGDAIQVNGPTYVVDSEVYGTGDTILGRGPTYWERCTFKSTRVIMWIRNTAANHGNVFNRCKFIGTEEPTTIARSPQNNVSTYPYAEAVLLNSTLVNIASEGWGEADKGGNVHFWEYNSRNADGSPADGSKRAPWSRQLDKVKDAKLIADYSDPAFVLGGWRPDLKAR